MVVVVVVVVVARWDFFEQKAAKSPAQINCQRLTPTRLLKLKKMADASDVFSNTV